MQKVRYTMVYCICKKFCEDNNIQVITKIKEKNKPLDKIECAKFCKALNIPFTD